MVIGKGCTHDAPRILPQPWTALPVHEFTLNGISLCLPAGLATPEILGKLADGSYEADEALAAER